jgi:hypothetical protein
MLSFPDGLRGVALLWLRWAAAIALIQSASISLTGGNSWTCVPLFVSALCLGVGFLTPLVGLVVAIAEVTEMIAHLEELWRSSFLITSILIALTLLGPGAYSMDRWLFGRKRLTIGRSRS